MNFPIGGKWLARNRNDIQLLSSVLVCVVSFTDQCAVFLHFNSKLKIPDSVMFEIKAFI